MEENWKRIPPALRGTGKSENSRAGIFPTGVASVAKVRSREWQKFRLGPRNNWFHRLERSRGQLHRYRRVDDGAARIEDLEGTPSVTFLHRFRFPFPFSRVHRVHRWGQRFPPCRKTANYLSVPHPRCALVESSFR